MNEELRESFPDFMAMDGYDDCILGVCQRCGSSNHFAYSTKKVIAKLMEEDGMTLEEANDFFSFNQVGAYVGATTPCFVEEIDND